MRVKDNRLEQVKQKVDLRSVIVLAQARPYNHYIAGLCPFHENDGGQHKTLSFMLYADHYKCLSPKCGQYGDVFNWVSYQLYGDPRSPLKSGRFGDVLEYVIEHYANGTAQPIQQREKREKVKLTSTQQEELEDLAATYHKNLMVNPRRLMYFYGRGFTPATIKREMWGWDGSNYVITVWRGTPRKSRLITLRLRAASEDALMRYSGLRNINDQVLYNRDALLWCIRHAAPALLVFYGEFDARLAWQDGIPAVSPTNGALAFLPKWLKGYNGSVIFFPDKGEEQAGYSDAETLGKRGWMCNFPRGKFKDYSAMRKTREASELIEIVRRETGLSVMRRRWA